MKFILLFLLVSSAYGSKARLNALGGEEVAKNYFYDTRNVLFNPSYLNINGDYIVFEWGEDYAGPELNRFNPKGEGGVFRSINNFVYGIYLGQDQGSLGRTDSGGNVLYEDNAWEVFLAGDAGLKWGASFRFSQNKDDQKFAVKRKQSSLGVKYGMLLGPWEAYVNLVLFDNSKGGSSLKEEYEAKIGTTLGFIYSHHNWVFSGEFSRKGYIYKRALDGKEDREWDYDQTLISAGQITQVNERATLLVDLGVKYQKTNRKKNKATSEIVEEEYNFLVPLTLAIEMKVKQWLQVRGMVKQNITSREKNSASEDRTQPSSTEVSTGATLSLGKLKIDGQVGATDSTGASGKKGILSLNNLFSQVSMTYWF